MRARPGLRAIVLAASVALLAGCTAPQPMVVPSPSPDPAPRQQQDKRIVLSDAALDRLVTPTQPGCSAAVAVLGEVVWARAAGTADLSAGTPLTTATRFNIASVSKQFTAEAILMLQREGKLSLSDPIGAYLDGLPPWGTTITLDQLMHHTSHLRDFWKALQGSGIQFGDYVSHDDIVKAIIHTRRLEPGTGYLYSNANYVLLAEVVKRVSGLALPEFLDQRIFKALGLAMVVSPNLKAPDVAVSYDDNNQRQDSGWSAYGYSEIFTTPSELARWGEQYRTGTIIDPAFAMGAVDMHQNGALYAAGIELWPDAMLRHDGRLGGHITTFRISPNRQTTVVVMCNGHAANRSPIADALWSIWVDRPSRVE